MVFPLDRRPTAAGVYSYWLGGNDHYEADRELAGRICEAFGDDEESRKTPRRMARSNRRYLAAAIRYMAGQDIRQFLDLGCGYPVTGKDDDALRSTHETAEDADPHARVVYIDCDPEVAGYITGVLAEKARGIDAACADIAGVRGVMSSGAVRDLIDPGEPCGLVFGLSLHYLPPARAQVTVAAYVSAVAPGSMAVVTVPRYGDEVLFRRVRDACEVAGLHNFSDAEVAGLFGDLDVLQPGTGPVAACRPGWEVRGEPGAVYVSGGIGVKR